MKANESERIAEIGVAVAKLAFESLGFAFRVQSESDYGIDAHAELIRSGEASGQLLGVQVKAGKSYFSETGPEGFVFRFDDEHATYWLGHALPVVVCLCDTESRRAYWQVVDQETVQSTGAGWKLTVPFDQEVSQKSLAGISHMLSPVVTADRYTMVGTEDVSHGAAKRYSFSVVLNGTYSKAEIASVVRQVTREGRGSRYYRSDITDAAWGDSDARVVWVYVYPSVADQKRCNQICHSYWCSEDLEEQFRPSGLQGENVGDGIVVEWSDNYGAFSKLYSDHALSKEEYLKQVLPSVEKIERLLSEMDGKLDITAYTEDAGEQLAGRTEEWCRRVAEMDYQVSEVGTAPYECSEVDAKLRDTAVLLDNVRMFCSADHLESTPPRIRFFQAARYLKDARESLGHLKYEIAKIR